jgi:SAM-dependent methyltransferase
VNTIGEGERCNHRSQRVWDGKQLTKEYTVALFHPPKTEETLEHYTKVVQDSNYRGTLGKDSRFNCDKALRSPSIKRYFTDKVKGFIQPTDRVLDVGCGAGIFLPILSPMCQELTGIDVVPAFVQESERTIERFGLKNTRVMVGQSEGLAFPDNAFDVAILLHVVHHLADIPGTMAEVKRVTRPGGRIIIYEPNKLNPAIFVMHTVDPNERGAIQMGRKGIYRRLFGRDFDIERMDYNGILIGHDAYVSQKIADLLNAPVLSSFLGWLNPNIFITLINRK